MSDDVLIKVEGVSKKFCRSLKRSMLYGLEDIARDTLDLPLKTETLRKEEFWAVDDISFEVKRGECLGIIGRNGAGKSTLLKILSGIILPDKGKVTVRGRVGALIEVGAGFHPMLTGRENIYLNGSILGLRKKEIDRKLDEIIAFAELEDFIDMPVKHYSSGMYVRLGFAIAAHVDPDILLLDEVLAVGDLAFTAKCLRHLSQHRPRCAMLLVSHDMRAISRLSTAAIYIESGHTVFLGSPPIAINRLREDCHNHAVTASSCESDALRISKIELRDATKLRQHDPLTLDIHLDVKALSLTIRVNVAIFRNDGTHCCGLMSEPLAELGCRQGANTISLHFPRLALMPGSYNFSIYVWDTDMTALLAAKEQTASFFIVGSELTYGVFMPEHHWKLNPRHETSGVSSLNRTS